ncbi:CGNR zinc finger domain-containing protein [Paenibacillus sp. FSL K6-3182]|uniref:CGNR zinc finger domain-containing protein n=1 Tax=unclassified Paenibacillus TaxID=185978 RepID=UPI002E103467
MDKPAFVFVGNHFTTDFVNTRKNVKGIRTELIESWGHLMSWLEQADRRKWVISDREELTPDEQDTIIQKILIIRSRIEQAFTQIIQEQSIPASIVTFLNQELARYRSYYQIEAGDQERPFTTVRNYEITQLPALFLEEACLFFTTFKLANLKKCENHACILFFYDSSRNQQRRWCSMDKCGNRVKVNQHYHRKKNQE